MLRSSASLVGLAAAALAFISNSALATISAKQDLKQLLAQSELVFRGKVVEVKYEVGSEMPWTLYTFADVVPIVGQVVEDVFSLRCAGGVVGDRVTVLNGTPIYEVGDEALVFFDEDDRACQITAWHQGSFRIVKHPTGREYLVDESGRPVVDIDTDGLRVTPSAKNAALVARHAPGGATIVSPILVPVEAATVSSNIPDQGANADRTPEPIDWSAVRDALQYHAQRLGKRWTPAKRTVSAVGPQWMNEP